MVMILRELEQELALVLEGGHLVASHRNRRRDRGSPACSSR